MKVNQKNRVGFKFTKVGQIPDDWECVELSSACMSGGDYGAPVSSIDYLPSLPRYIRITDISEDGRLHDDDLKSVPNDIPSEFLLNKGDFLFARSGASVGKTYLHKDEGRFVFAGYLIRFNPNPEILVGDYLTYFTHSHLYKAWKNTTIRTGAQPNINANEYSKLLLPIPKVAEQKRIVQILSTWDCAIENLEKLIDAKQRLKKGLMQQLLTGKMRFPEFPKLNNRKVTTFGNIPNDWSYVSISRIATQIIDINKKKQEFPILSCTKYNGLVDSLVYFGKQVFSTDTSSYKIVKRNCFAYATNHIEEGSIGYQNLYDFGLISPMYTVFRTNGKIDDGFLYKLLKTDLFTKIFKINTNASVNRRGSLRWQNFSKIHIPLPTIKEQQKISQMIDISENEILVLDRKLKILRKQKRGLMQKLLSGEVRVKNKESL